MDTFTQIQPTAKNSPYSWWQVLELGIFWSWNLMFLAFMLLGFAPVVLPSTFTAVRTGVIPAVYLVYALVLALIPLLCTCLGWTALRQAPSRLFALGFVVEAPLMLMLAVRFFAIRQATFGITLLIGVVLVGMAAFLWNLLDRQAGTRRPALELLRLAGLTLMAAVSLYAAAWIAFYALPLSVEALRVLIDWTSDLLRVLQDLGRSLRSTWESSPLNLPFLLLGFILLLFTGMLFVLAAAAVPILSLRTWWRAFRRQVQRLGWVRPVILVCLTAAVTVGLFMVSNRQPQRQVFDLLAEPPASQEAARDLVARSASIRAGLLNAYLAPFRYISAQGEVTHIRGMYESTFNLSPRQALGVQRVYERLVSPLLYQPVHPQTLESFQDNRALAVEPQEAALLYQRFFDTPIIQGERTAIVEAVRSTWASDAAEAAWQAVDDREVHLARQEVTLEEHGDWADLELHEVYQNQTGERQEVIYFFSLPESAVITGLWLGNAPDKSQAFAYQIAPRGAAQAVYREQTRVMKDPALLEQIGPRQYRLRVYPIPPLRMEYDADRARTLVEDAPELHLWLSWREMAAGDAWPMPSLAHLRNVYWDQDSLRLVNGSALDAPGDIWLPESIPAAGPVAPAAHRVDFPGDQSVLALPAGGVSLPELPQTLRLAVVLDRSASMQDLAGQVEEALNRLKVFSAPDQPVDLYLTSSPYRGEEPSRIALGDFDPAGILYFGGQNAAELIAQYEALRGDREYDAVLVLTDGTGYELGQSPEEVPVPEAPVWLVHLGGAIPLGYDDQTLEAVQASGGGVTGDLETALVRAAVARSAPAEEPSGVRDLLDGYLWITLPTSRVDSALPTGIDLEIHDPGSGFAALAARSLILAEMQRSRGTIDDLETLDYLHALAVSNGIVTPYSSMIVLVETRQQLLLDELSELDDRYQREVESLGETTPASPVPLVGVPEPHEWLLMGIAAALLLYSVYSQRRFAEKKVKI